VEGKERRRIKRGREERGRRFLAKVERRNKYEKQKMRRKKREEEERRRRRRRKQR
jgi:hypothetical protein